MQHPLPHPHKTPKLLLKKWWTVIFQNPRIRKKTKPFKIKIMKKIEKLKPVQNQKSINISIYLFSDHWVPYLLTYLHCNPHLIYKLLTYDTYTLI
jgi:hypothetical protein